MSNRTTITWYQQSEGSEDDCLQQQCQFLKRSYAWGRHLEHFPYPHIVETPYGFVLCANHRDAWRLNAAMCALGLAYNDRKFEALFGPDVYRSLRQWGFATWPADTLPTPAPERRVVTGRQMLTVRMSIWATISPRLTCLNRGVNEPTRKRNVAGRAQGGAWLGAVVNHHKEQESHDRHDRRGREHGPVGARAEARLRGGQPQAGREGGITQAAP